MYIYINTYIYINIFISSSSDPQYVSSEAPLCVFARTTMSSQGPASSSVSGTSYVYVRWTRAGGSVIRSQRQSRCDRATVAARVHVTDTYDVPDTDDADADTDDDAGPCEDIVVLAKT